MCRVEIKKIKLRKTIEEKPKSWYFEQVNKSGKSLVKTDQGKTSPNY